MSSQLLGAGLGGIGILLYLNTPLTLLKEIIFKGNLGNSTVVSPWIDQINTLILDIIFMCK